jgi:hypothetical protein
MLFRTLYLACIALWAVAPSLGGHQLFTAIVPQFRLLDLPNFLYGFVASAIYGWIVSATFVFFYNLWPRFSAVVSGKAVTR